MAGICAKRLERCYGIHPGFEEGNGSLRDANATGDKRRNANNGHKRVEHIQKIAQPVDGVVRTAISNPDIRPVRFDFGFNVTTE
jgi:hypothetical protein